MKTQTSSTKKDFEIASSQFNALRYIKLHPGIGHSAWMILVSASAGFHYGIGGIAMGLTLASGASMRVNAQQETRFMAGEQYRRRCQHMRRKSEVLFGVSLVLSLGFLAANLAIRTRAVESLPTKVTARAVLGDKRPISETKKVLYMFSWRFEGTVTSHADVIWREGKHCCVVTDEKAADYEVDPKYPGGFKKIADVELRP
jgi:hypothetical protein